jgi:hypothetical protein
MCLSIPIPSGTGNLNNLWQAGLNSSVFFVTKCTAFDSYAKKRAETLEPSYAM